MELAPVKVKNQTKSELKLQNQNNNNRDPKVVHHPFVYNGDILL